MIEIDKKFIDHVLKETCTDLNDNDRKHIVDLIDQNMPKNLINQGFFGYNVWEVITAAAYLYSKCPGNSDQVISYKKAKIKLSNYNSKASITKGIKTVKELGFIAEYCVVTSTIILRNMKNQLKELTVNHYDTLTKEHMTEILEYAIILSGSDKVKKLRQGKSQYAVAGGCFYIASIVIQKKVTQKFVAELFNVTDVAIRNRYIGIATKEQRKLNRSNTYTHAFRPRMSCKDCVYRGIEFKRKVSWQTKTGDLIKNIKRYKCTSEIVRQKHSSRWSPIEFYSFPLSSLDYKRICEIRTTTPTSEGRIKNYEYHLNNKGE